jgi:copper chaperone
VSPQTRARDGAEWSSVFGCPTTESHRNQGVLRMIELNVTGMTCQHCVRAASNALARVPGVTRVVEVSLQPGRAVVEGTASVEALVAALRQEGYGAEVA